MTDESNFVPLLNSTGLEMYLQRVLKMEEFDKGQYLELLPQALGKSFELGQLTISYAATVLLQNDGQFLIDCVTRHADGDWGDLTVSEHAAANASLLNGLPVRSRYFMPDDRGKVDIFTPSNRSYTLIFDPEELANLTDGNL